MLAEKNGQMRKKVAVQFLYQFECYIESQKQLIGNKL